MMMYSYIGTLIGLIGLIVIKLFEVDNINFGCPLISSVLLISFGEANRLTAGFV